MKGEPRKAAQEGITIKRLSANKQTKARNECYGRILIKLNDLGSLSYEPRGNLSLFTGMYYRTELGDWQENSSFREVIPRVICPFCPVIFGLELRNYLRGK